MNYITKTLKTAKIALFLVQIFSAKEENKMIQQKEKMISSTVQFTQLQEDNLYSIMEFENISSKAELVRKAVDFYIEKNYPQLVI